MSHSESDVTLSNTAVLTCSTACLPASSTMLRLLFYVTAVLHVCTRGVAALCQGDQCTLCTVSGHTVITVSDQAYAVEDRCVYSLLKTSSIPNVVVKARFQERRRKDISFLDSVTLSLSNGKISLEQGGRVTVDDTEETIDSTGKSFHSVDVSKNQAGVTAKFTHSNYDMTVFFDGYTAQIHIKGPSGQAPTVEGLCGNSNGDLTGDKLSEEGEEGCDTDHNDDTDDTSDCSGMTARCNLLTQAPFMTCHSNVGHTPYVTACTNTLCHYPAKDGLKCQFLEAYARACSLYSDDAMDSWRTSAACSPQAYCQGQFCSAEEFCGDNSNGDGTRCHCRAIFASPYRTDDTLGDPAVCDGSSRSVSLVGCLLEDKGISYSKLHLYDKTCTANKDAVTHRVTLSFDSSEKPCGTMIRMNSDDELINKNAVLQEGSSHELVDFTCPFVIPDINIDFAVNIKVKSGTSSSSVAYVSNGIWDYVLTMKAYTDAGRTQAVTQDTHLKLNQKVWFELKADGLNNNVALVTHACFATHEESAESTDRYQLITNGCPNTDDKTLHVESNGEGHSNYFSFNMFQFSGKSGDVYLHCQMSLCIKSKEVCVPDCSQNGRRRRSVKSKQKENPPVIILAWGS
ncbi:alpha-tectorin-like [Plectropomus leopardus]|uniref:alpha-tectorin-like n=1 Tax=Plectropomus leopardus TaxID=160734 RepID=UPI001C4B142A|nr:alpha-tectorin-like [Plectropomus leopardus]